MLERDLKVMDTAAISLCRDNGIPIGIFNLGVAGNIRRVVLGERVGSVVRAHGRRPAHVDSPGRRRHRQPCRDPSPRR